MKLDLLFLLSALVGSGHAFTIVGPKSTYATTSTSRSVTMTPTDDVMLGGDTSDSAKEKLLLLCRRLKDENGLFLVDKKAKKEFKDAVVDLEKFGQEIAFTEPELAGEWTLLCTTSTSKEGIDMDRIKERAPPGFESLRDTVRRAANRYLTVQQVIRTSEEDATVIDRIDHVLSFSPPKQLQDLVENLPSQLMGLNINPLDVTKSKLVLIHKASMEEGRKTSLALKSVVWNVAGSSTLLDPNGKDLLGINLPWGEFVNGGDFETTFMDDTIRISRTPAQGLAPDVLRVFVRSGSVVTEPVLEDIASMEADGRLDSTVNAGDEGVDVDEVVDSDFEADDHEGQDDVSPSDY